MRIPLGSTIGLTAHLVEAVTPLPWLRRGENQ
jgi:hypothetical protein